MQLVKKYNALHNKRVSRFQLEELLNEANRINQLEIIDRLNFILKNNPNDDLFFLKIKNPVIDNSLNAPRHKGLLKEALTECGRLKKVNQKGKTALFGLNGTYEVPKNPTVESTLKFAEENLFGKYVTNRDVGKKIKFTKNGIKKAIRGKRGISKIRLQLVYISKQVLQSARLVKTEKDKKKRKQIKNIYKLNASHIINGHRYNVYIVLRESLNGSIYYDHDAVKVKKDVKQTGDDSKKSNSTPLCKPTSENKDKNKNQVNQKNNVTPLQKLGYVQASTAPKKAKNVFRLNGEIGNFLQDIQRHKELILIKGNKHSSKSQLAMQIANALGEKELLVAYIDYEQGGLDSKDTIDSLNRNTTPEGKQNIFVKGFVENPMEELEELCINCDAIVADSITDLGISADEINYLRGKYEDVIWCFISQVKSNGEMYGGNKMAHNPTKIIHCTSDKDFTKRIATLEKNRGGDLTLLYNIYEKKVQW